MKKKKGFDRVLLFILVAALIAVAAVIVYKQFEYKASEDFYTGLLGGDSPTRKAVQTFVPAPEHHVTRQPSQEPENTAAPEASATAEPSAAVDATATPIPTLPPLTDEEVEDIVLALFGAVVGTDTKTEKAVRQQIEADIRNAAAADTPEASEEPTMQPEGSPQPTEVPLTVDELVELALEERSAQLRQYRAVTLPYLLAALESAEEEAAPTPVPTPTPVPSAEPTEEVVVYTVEDSFAALSENEFGQAYLAVIEPLGGTDLESCLYLTKQICQLWFEQVDHEKLSWMNEEYLFWIYAPNTYIDYPVVQSEDNSEYLHKMFNGQRNAAGTLFIDYRNLTEFRDPNTLIYGHNMRNNSMFGALTEYEDQAYYEAHPYMLVFDGKKTYLVEVFAAYVTSDQDHCYDIAISGEEDMAAFVNTAVRKSDIETGVEVAVSDKLVTLSTCAYVFEDARYIAIGRLVPIRVK